LILQLIHAPLEVVDLFYADSRNMAQMAFVELLATIWLIIFAAMTFFITLKIPLPHASQPLLLPRILLPLPLQTHLL